MALLSLSIMGMTSLAAVGLSESVPSSSIFAQSAMRREVILIQETIENFKSKHPDFSIIPSEVFSEYVAEGQRDLARKLQVPAESIIPLNPDQLGSLKASRYLMVRHGVQSEGDCKSLPPAEKKIALMRKEANEQNPITNQSLVDLFAVALGLSYALHDSSVHWSVQSSHNARATEAAQVIAYALGVPLSQQSKWDCINYSSDKTTEALLKRLPGGVLPWEQGVVDEIVGPGTFEVITSDVQGSLKQEGILIVTHTQQINALQRMNGLPEERLKEYGLIALSIEGNPQKLSLQNN